MARRKTLGSLGEKIKIMEDLAKFFKNKKVLITGHTGFKGSWLTQILLNWGANVTGIALKPSTSPSLFNLLGIEKQVKNYFADIRNFGKVKEIILKEKPEIVFHLAAQPLVRESYENPLYTFQTNIIGTANILQAIKESGEVKSAVMVTTDKVYENKEKLYAYKETDKLGGYDPYSSSKASAEIVINSYIKSFFNPEKYKKLHTILVASVRAGNVIGGGDWSRDRIMPDIVKSIFEKSEKLIVRSPESIRPWQFVIEPLYGYLLLAKKLYEGKKELCGAYNFGPLPKNYLSVNEIAKKTFKLFKKGSYAVKKDSKIHEASFLKLNIGKAKNKLGWTPILNIDKTLELTSQWYEDFYNKKNIVETTNQQIKSFFDNEL